MRFSIIAFAALVSSVAAAPTQSLEVRETDQQATDRLLFQSTISVFITARNAKNPATLDWSSDGCSDSPDNPLGFNFLNSCYRHDFGYRNYKAQGRFTDAGKLSIDNNFRTDLYNQCETESLTTICKALANVYYEAVREFGKKKAAEILATSMAAAEEEAAKEIARRAAA